ncbi:MAG: preprotein translocase subunit SecG [Gammaproteobacteria bacterium RIFCSPHIGHO2_02_FULL_42_13]|nr:MAG: preprotein translocase subunit SecG [Gammaproteobacteria bacterium RIFCSPHIGHO2_02_FULL_42_13]OGT68503.1 MAG: preprotein translocase subunit SecG [Gammaproteobacteria bacterium RIFCSPLOWO2_02_FULL_42_9]
MQQIILIFHIVIAIALIGLVLIQRGKGADMGAAFGSGASQTVFGSRGSGGFLFRVTIFLAALFFATSITLTYLAAHQHQTNQSQDFLSNVEKVSQDINKSSAQR